MQQKTLVFDKTRWIDIVNPSDEIVDSIIAEYDFHELDKEAVLEPWQSARVDTYEDYIFVILQFPKYDPKTKRYLTNELNIFLSEHYIITFRFYASQTIDTLQNTYERVSDTTKISSWSILYEIIDLLLSKTFKTLERFSKDVRIIEKALFSELNQGGKDLIQEMMIKKRNAITLKHMVRPQIGVIKLLELRTNAMFEDSFEAYFENLDDKIQKIASEIDMLHENVESMEATMKILFDLETNSTIKYLTFFSAFMLPLTLITSFFGMNIENVPFTDWIVYGLLIGTTIGLVAVLWILKKKKKI
jgi:magnesium transporter